MTKKNIGITTVGTSALTNFLRIVLKSKFTKYQNLKTNILEILNISDEQELYDRYNIQLMNQLIEAFSIPSNQSKIHPFFKILNKGIRTWFHILKQKGKHAQFSAEYSTIQLLQNKRIFSSDSHVQNHLDFLYSDTLNGEWCARILKEIFEKESDIHYSVNLYRIEGLNYHPKKFHLGLNSIVNTVITRIEDYLSSNRSQKETTTNNVF